MSWALSPCALHLCGFLARVRLARVQPSAPSLEVKATGTPGNQRRRKVVGKDVSTCQESLPFPASSRETLPAAFLLVQGTNSLVLSARFHVYMARLHQSTYVQRSHTFHDEQSVGHGGAKWSTETVEFGTRPCYSVLGPLLLLVLASTTHQLGE